MLIENYKNQIISKLQTDYYGYNEIQSEKIYKSVFTNYPDELISNLEEWLLDKPISRIEYKNTAIRDIMYQDYDKNGHIVYDFVDCFRLIKNYLQSDKKNELLLSYLLNYGAR